MTNNLSNLNVWYGWSVLNKVRKKPAISVIFENEDSVNDRKTNQVKRLQRTVFVRKQTVDEAADGRFQNRILTEYCTFLFGKPFNGDVEKLLENNFQADINNVGEEILIEIKNALRNVFKQTYTGIKL